MIAQNTLFELGKAVSKLDDKELQRLNDIAYGMCLSKELQEKAKECKGSKNSGE